MPRLLLLLPTTTYRTAAFVEAARRVGVELTVASEQPSTFEAANPAGLVTLDFRNPARAAEQARAFARDHTLSAVVGVDDDTAALASVLAQALGVPANPPHATAAARDKYAQRRRLAAAGVPVPRFALQMLSTDPAVIAGNIAYPCVLKPLRLAASRGVIRADDPKGFIAAFQRIKALDCDPPVSEILIEEFVPGYEVALEGLLVGQRLHTLAIFDKPDPLDGPFFEETIYVTPSRVPAALQASITQTVERAGKALGLTGGPIHAELRYNERGAWIIELAARPIGGRCSAVLRFGGGEVTLEEIILRQALGMPIPSLERERGAAGVMMIPIPGAGTLQEVRGVAEARAVPHIESVEITARPGEVLVPFPEGSRYPGFIFARADTPDVVEQALRDAHRRLTFVLK